MTRNVRVLVLLGAFLAGLAFCFAVVMLITRQFGGPGVTQVAAVGGPFRLIDQDARPITDQDLKGKPFLVFFGFTHCPDICPTTLFEVSEVMRALGPDAARTRGLFITVDPERDTPEVMKNFVSNFDPALRGVTGDMQSIADVARAYRAYYRKVPLEGGGYTMDHTSLVYLMDKDGRFVAPFNLKRTPEMAAADLRRYF